MSQRETLAPQPQQPDEDALSWLHSSLRASFVALPPAGTALTPEQLQAIFGENLQALCDLAQLAYQSGEIGAE